MKLKGKLALSFGSLVALTLGVFGIITHYTFTESTRASAGEILGLQTENTLLYVGSAVADEVHDIKHALLTAPKGEFADSRSLAPLVAAKVLFNAVYFYPDPQLPAGLVRDAGRFDLPAVGPNQHGHQENALFASGERLYLLWHLPVIKKHLILEVDRESLASLIRDALHQEHATIIIGRNGTPLLPPVAKDGSTEVDSKGIRAALDMPATAQARLTPVGYQYQQPRAFWGADCTMVVPARFLFANLLVLKNRILTAVLVVGWVAIWAALILAHRIAAPIQRLNQATHDIIAFNYTSELGFSPNGDEIGELAASFETMRLKIKDLVAKDPLTGVYNRRFLMHVFELAVLKALRMGTELCIIMIDIDKFKRVNDTYGHQCGDRVLEVVGEILQAETRKYDTPARYGGEEFIFLLPETGVADAYTIAERLRTTLEARTIEFEGTTLRCTMSLGIGAFDPETAATTAAIIAKADSALYEAKDSGRNRTVIFSDDRERMPAPPATPSAEE